jgi:NADPH-dependent ferric siderophore reductase
MHGTVTAVHQLTPHMIRLVLGGDGLTDFTPVGHTDAYINVALPPEGAPYDMPVDLDEVQATLPREQWPVRRRYTVRRWDEVTRQLSIDVVVHGDVGVGGPWARSAQVGDVLQFTGPSGGYAPSPEVDWHLMVGDEAALPAIAASLEQVPAGALVHALVEVDGPADELSLDCPGALHLRWLHRGGTPGSDDLLTGAVQAMEWPAGRVQGFVHGEASMVRAVRRHLLVDRGMARADLSASPYWRRDMTDEAWRLVKKAWEAEVDADVA